MATSAFMPMNCALAVLDRLIRPTRKEPERHSLRKYFVLFNMRGRSLI
jgi:hypothetical protein